MKHRFYKIAGLTAAATVAAFAGAAWSEVTVAGNKGPSTAETPYVLPDASAAGVRTVSILTVGETVGSRVPGTTYRMVGIPDGLGAYDNGDGTFTLLSHHELSGTSGIARAHGSTGAFVSSWIIDRQTLQVHSGADLIRTLWLWNSATQTYATGTTQFSRFCSADLAAPTAFFDAASGKGTPQRIFLGGEENGNAGRVFATICDGPEAGTSAELPRLGKQSWENAVACPKAQVKTIVVGTDDSTPGQVVVYVGAKQTTGSTFDKAGLTGGTLYGVIANSARTEDRTNGIGLAKGIVGNFALVAVPNQAAAGAATETDLDAAAVTEFLRPEDGAWDPSNPTDFYFVTTDQFDTVKSSTGTTVGRSRLWRLRFNDLAAPETGGKITMLLDGTEPHQMLDNIGIDRFGNLLAQEDIGGNAQLGKIWHYSIPTGTWRPVGIFDQARFGTVGVPAAAGFSQDEESSGIIDAADLLGAGWWLLDVQAHVTANDTELVERGQFLALYLPEGVPAPKFVIEATASDTTPVVGDPVALWAKATAPGAGAVIEYSWDFGDGESAAGEMVQHTYLAPGDCTATVTAKHLASGKTATSQVTLSVARPSNTTRAVVDLDFGKSGKDRMELVGQFPVAADFSPAGKKVTIDFGGVVRTLTLDADGNAKSGDADFHLHVRHLKDGAIDSKAGWTLKVDKADLRGSFADEGLTSTPTAGKAVQIALETTLDGTSWDETLDLIWVVNDGKKGGVAR